MVETRVDKGRAGQVVDVRCEGLVSGCEREPTVLYKPRCFR